MKNFKLKLRNVFFVALITLLVACTLDAELADHDKNKLMKCVDTRDGEVFYFNTNTVHDAKVGICCTNSFKIVTTGGDTMILRGDMERWLKVTEVKSRN